VDTEAPPQVRSYGCQYGCGNAMDVMLYQFIDGSSLTLCIPCFVRTAIDIVRSMTENPSDELAAMVAEMAGLDMVDTPTARARRGKHNAPVGTDNAELIEQYDTALTEDELGDEFK
jgi:hypothetical protein